MLEKNRLRIVLYAFLAHSFFLHIELFLLYIYIFIYFVYVHVVYIGGEKQIRSEALSQGEPIYV